jgi:uncharacterized protein YkwD
MVLRYATVVLVTTVFATVAALSVSAIEPGKAKAANAVRTCGDGTITLNAMEERTFRRHNDKRTSRGLRALCVHRKLTKAARAHSASMIKKDYFGHGDVGSRLKHYGYNCRACGENIAGGSGKYARPGNIFRRWMKSSGHRANILDKRFREVGIGTATGTYKGQKGYTMYTVDFGTRR